MSCLVVKGRLMSIFDLFRFPRFPMMGYITTTLFFFLDVGIYYYYILVGAVPRRVSYLSILLLTNVSRPISFILELSDLPVRVDIAELFELTEDTDELRSTTFPYKPLLFLKSCDKLTLKIVSVGNVGLDN